MVILASLGAKIGVLSILCHEAGPMVTFEGLIGAYIDTFKYNSMLYHIRYLLNQRALEGTGL